jgi:hypothetical protein
MELPALKPFTRRHNICISLDSTQHLEGPWKEGTPVTVDINQLLQNEKLITAIAKRVRKLV